MLLCAQILGLYFRGVHLAHLCPHLIEVQLLFRPLLDALLHRPLGAQAVHMYGLGLGVERKVSVSTGEENIHTNSHSNLYCPAHLSNTVHPGHGLEVPLGVPGRTMCDKCNSSKSKDKKSLALCQSYILP